ncbi:uncharacterized protein QC761_0018040 [Podospora bellae-mahoneyi]|uniref:Uncharacterized protein n=1 Tax=Podospora bellae-mahoneyi TaxID=2093777 RepID=A0ABR0G059_9PEZI|nr:hypothetical protein QC761_0018040 [Podospora bellae-mahoneyi]
MGVQTSVFNGGRERSSIIPPCRITVIHYSSVHRSYDIIGFKVQVIAEGAARSATLSRRRDLSNSWSVLNSTCNAELWGKS